MKPWRHMEKKLKNNKLNLQLKKLNKNIRINQMQVGEKIKLVRKKHSASLKKSEDQRKLEIINY